MGTASTTKFMKDSAGTLTEEAALTTSAGAGDAQRIPALNANGVLDPTIINGKNSSAGAADAAKVPVLDASGRLDPTFMPVGVTVEAKDIQASEALSAGDYVNVWSNAGAWRIRKADATTAGKHAHGFVLAAVALNAQGRVYFEGVNTAVTGMTPGDVFLSTTAGLGAAAAPSGSGNVVQKLGTAISATEVNFEPQQHWVKA